jgi:hypothetical protein
LKIRASQKKKDLKSTPKKSNKQHQVSKKWMILIKYIYYTKNIILPLNDV